MQVIRRAIAHYLRILDENADLKTIKYLTLSL